jgi:hypothetical protein
MQILPWSKRSHRPKEVNFAWLSKITDMVKPSENGFPKPKKVNCFQCQKEFYIKFVLPRQEYSQKNN